MSFAFLSSGCFIQRSCLCFFVCFCLFWLDADSSFVSFDGLDIALLVLGRILDGCFHLLTGFSVRKEYVTAHDCSRNNIFTVVHVLTSVHEQISSAGPVDQSC